MRILQISSAAEFGGAEKHLVDLAKGLAELGDEVFIALRPASLWRARFEFLPQERLLSLPLRNALDVFSARRLARFVKENRIEIVHAHMARDYPLASLAVRLAPLAKLVLTRHAAFPLKRAQKLALSNASRVVAVSVAVAEILQKSFPAEKIRVVPSGIEIENLAPADRRALRNEFRAEHGIPPDAFLIGTVGALKRVKGQEDFVLAAQAIADKRENARFLFVGKDNSFDQSFRRRLKRLVRIFDLEPRFMWIDRADDTRRVLYALDVFVNASHTEALPLTILEAMACGAAIAATETEAAKELIENGKTGRLVPVENPARLAEAIIELAADGRRRATIGAGAQKIALARHDFKIMTTETRKIYRSLLEDAIRTTHEE